MDGLSWLLGWLGMDWIHVCVCGVHRLIYGSRWILCVAFRHQIWPIQSFSHRRFCRYNAHPTIFMGLILWCHLWRFTKILIQNVIAHTTEKEIDWKWQISPQNLRFRYGELLLFSNGSLTVANDVFFFSSLRVFLGQSETTTNGDANEKWRRKEWTNKVVCNARWIKETKELRNVHLNLLQHERYFKI